MFLSTQKEKEHIYLKINYLETLTFHSNRPEGSSVAIQIKKHTIYTRSTSAHTFSGVKLQNPITFDYEKERG